MVQKAAVLGSPISHSLSPVLHRAAYKALGLDWTYEAIEMTPAMLPEFLAELDSEWRGLSLTMPLKESVQPLLASIDDLAARTGSVNTICHSHGGWHGWNTDVFGIRQALHEAGCLSASSARILGAGATARSAVAAMAALGVGSLVICARRLEQGRELEGLAADFGMATRVSGLEPTDIDEDLLVSVLPGDAASPWASSRVSTRTALLDASYHPWPSALAAAWPGRVVASGRDMLLWQATEQVRLMTGQPAPVEAMRSALERI